MDDKTRNRLLATICDVLGREKRLDEFDVEDYIQLYNSNHPNSPIQRRTASDHLQKFERNGLIISRRLYNRTKVYSYVDTPQDT